jgi:putative PIN family toxin of toxin-antitoxin system
MMRVCLDTNVLVAAFAARGLCADLLRLVMAEHELILLEVVEDELYGVLAGKLKLSEEALSSVQSVLGRCEKAPRTDTPSPVSLRDPDDEKVLVDAVAAGAQILVSGDQDLLVAAHESPIPIVSPRAFLTLITGGTR